MPVPSTTPATAVVWSALPSRNSRAIITTMGRITSPKAIGDPLRQLARGCGAITQGAEDVG